MAAQQPLLLAGAPSDTAECRRLAADTLAGVDQDVVSDVQLVLTELVANAHLHGQPPVVVTVERHGAGARVEVRDTGKGRLVMATQSPDAMTGRGLALVAAIAESWGVEPAPDGGKAVWASVVPGADERPQPPEVDLEALLAAWDDDPLETEYTIRLGAVPTGLLLNAKRHIDNVVRELTFERAGATEPLAPELEALVDTVTGDFARARAGIKEQAAAAAARGDTQTELVLTLPQSAVQAGTRYLEALDEVDRYAREARILTLETPPLHRLFRRWYVTALVEQLRARAEGEQVRQPKPFVEVLVEEVESLSVLRESAQRLELLQRVNAALTDAHTPEAMAQAVLSSSMRELGAMRGRVYLAEAGVLRVIASPGTLKVHDLQLDADLPEPIVFTTGQAMVLRSLAQIEERFPDLAASTGSERTVHVVPLEVGAHRLGVMTLAFPPTSRHDERAQTAYVRALADALAQGLERIDVAARLSRLGSGGGEEPSASARRVAAGIWVTGDGERRLKDLAGAARAIAGARSVEELLDVLTDAARTIVGTHQAAASRLYGGSWDRHVTRISLSDDYAQWRDYERAPAGLGVLNAVTRENKPLRLSGEQLRSHVEFRALRDAPGHPPLPDYLAAPLISRDGRNIGLVQLSHKTDGTDFDEVDEAVVVQLALMVSVALEHLEVAGELECAMEQLRDEQKVVDNLHEVGRAVTSQLEHSDVVQTVTDAATQMTGAQFGAFFYNVIGEDGESFALYSISGVPREAFSRFPMPRNTDIFGPTFRGEGVVRLEDVTADPRYGRMEPHRGMPEGHLPVRSYLAVPVSLSDGEVVGGLFFGHAEPGVFDEHAEDLAVGIAAYASIALENGRLYDAARQESRAKEEVAAALERPLQPLPLPEIPGVEVAALYQPLGGSGRLGGDFYDVFPLDGGRWMLALGDVAGKGPEAAALTGLVRHTVWGAAQYASDPAAVARAVNTALLRQHTERFATLVLAVLTPAQDEVLVEAVWAGHPAGVLVRPDGIELVAGIGVPVGLFPDLQVERLRFSLQPGDSLLLYTDGLVERLGAVLDEKTLVQLVESCGDGSMEELLDCLSKGVEDLRPARDDVAAVALRASRGSDGA